MKFIWNAKPNSKQKPHSHPKLRSLAFETGAAFISQTDPQICDSSSQPGGLHKHLKRFDSSRSNDLTYRGNLSGNFDPHPDEFSRFDKRSRPPDECDPNERPHDSRDLNSSGFDPIDRKHRPLFSQPNKRTQHPNRDSHLSYLSAHPPSQSHFRRQTCPSHLTRTLLTVHRLIFVLCFVLVSLDCFT